MTTERRSPLGSTMRVLVSLLVMTGAAAMPATAAESVTDLLDYLGLRPGLEKRFIRNRKVGDELTTKVMRPEIRDSVEVWGLTLQGLSRSSWTTTYYATDGEAIWVHAEELQSKPYTTQGHSNIRVLRHPLRPGEFWTSCSSKDCAKSSYISTSFLKAIENVTVPRGQFQQCLRVSTHYIFKHTKDKRETITWFCKGIGMVKHLTRDAKGEETYTELTEFKPELQDVAVLKRKPVADLPVPCTKLMTNPFAFEGKTVRTRLTFHQMVARDRAFFEGGEKCGVVASGIPLGKFSATRVPVVLVGRVIGTTEVAQPTGKVSVPELRFTGVQFCQEEDCGDLLKE